MATEKTILNIRMEADQFAKLKELIASRMSETNGVQMDAAGLVLTELMQRQDTEKVSASCDACDRVALLEKWSMPEKIGAIVLALINDPGNGIDSVDAAFDYIMRPYWDQDVLVPDQSDIDNYKAAVNA